MSYYNDILVALPRMFSFIAMIEHLMKYKCSWSGQIEHIRILELDQYYILFVDYYLLN